jgi:hypothetical protein
MVSRRGWVVLQVLALVAFLGVVSWGILARIDRMQNRSQIQVLADFELIARASATGYVDSERRECDEEEPGRVASPDGAATSGSREGVPFGARSPEAERGIQPPLWELEPWIPQEPFRSSGRNRYAYTAGSRVLSCETWRMIFLGTI